MTPRFLLLPLVVTTVIFGGAPTSRAATDDRRMNIILILADDLGYETIGANGGESYFTPNLDRLAANGVRFEHCYAQPVCTPSRVQLMTGQYNVRNYTKFGVLNREERTFANLLKENGYATCIAGKWQLGGGTDAPQHFGFDDALLWQHLRGARREDTKHDTRYSNPRFERNGVAVDYNNGEFGPDVMADFVCGFIRDNRDKPFLVYYPMILTHCPFVPTPLSADWDPKSKGADSYKGDAKYFGDMVHYMDRLVGKVVEEVKRQGLEDRTIILFTGDNGTDMPIISRLNGKDVAGGKGSTTDAGTRVPLIAYGPGHLKPAVVSDLVDFSDFLPTLCELAGIPVPATPELDGRSFAPQLSGRKGSPRKYVYSWFSAKGDEGNARVFARTHRYKLYRSGEFFDVVADNLEKSPLPEAALSGEEKQVRDQLRNAIDYYQGFRKN